jgi:hypothetical protein
MNFLTTDIHGFVYAACFGLLSIPQRDKAEDVLIDILTCSRLT